MKIFFIADAHIAYLLYANRRNIKGDNYRALSSVVDAIIEDKEKDKVVVFCGDNLDSKSPQPSDIKLLQDVTKRLAKAGIPIFGIEGNHDRVAARKAAGEDDPEELSGPDTDNRWIGLVEDIELLTSNPVKLKSGLTMCGLDYIQGKGIYDALGNIPECDILVLHQPFSHVSPFEANILEVEGVPDQVRKAVVFGHVHISDKRQTSNGVWVVSPGSTHSQKLTHPHGAIAVYDVESNEFSFMQTPDHRKMCRYICETVDHIKRAEKDIKEMLSDDDDKKPIIGLKYKAALSEEVKAFQEKYEKQIHLFKKVVPDDVDQVTADDIKDLSTCEILDKLMETLSVEDEADVKEGALSIIEGSPDKVFNKLRKMEDERNEIIKTISV